MDNIKKTEIVVRKDNSFYGEFDYQDILQLRLDIIEGRITEHLYFRNEHGGVSEMSRIDEFGVCSHYHPFRDINELISKIIRAQIKKHNESN